MRTSSQYAEKYPQDYEIGHDMAAHNYIVRRETERAHAVSYETGLIHGAFLVMCVGLAVYIAIRVLS